MRVSHAVLTLAALLSVTACGAAASNPLAPGGRARLDGAATPTGSSTTAPAGSDSTTVARGGIGLIGSGN